MYNVRLSILSLLSRWREKGKRRIDEAQSNDEEDEEKRKRERERGVGIEVWKEKKKGRGIMGAIKEERCAERG